MTYIKHKQMVSQHHKSLCWWNKCMTFLAISMENYHCKRVKHIPAFLLMNIRIKNEQFFENCKDSAFSSTTLFWFWSGVDLFADIVCTRLAINAYTKIDFVVCCARKVNHCLTKFVHPYWRRPSALGLTQMEPKDVEGQLERQS